MKQWKLIVVTLLAVLLVCVCTSAMADDACAHANKVEIGIQPEGQSFTNINGEGHKWSYIVKYYCEDCENTISVPKSSNVNHVWNQTVVAPTCTDDGYTIYTCALCGGSYNWDVKGALDHDFSVFVKHVDRNCEERGYDIYKCSRCEETKIYNLTADKNQPTGHSPVATTVDSTCAKEGLTTYTCQWCNKVTGTQVVAKKPHSPVETYTPATCVTSDRTVVACQFCGEVFQDTEWGNKGDHKYVKGEKVAPNGCFEDGYTIYTCENCDETFKFDIVKKSHNWIKVAAVKAECGKDGMAAYSYCEYCGMMCDADGHVITKKPVITAPSPVHDWIIKSQENATCEKEGKVSKECRYCNKKVTEVVAKFDHDYRANGWVVVKAAGCVTTGIKTNKCYYCGGHELTEVIPAIGHQYKDASALAKYPVGNVAGVGYVYTKSSCTTTGTGLLKCTNSGCDMTINCTIPAIGHNWGAWVYSDPATCTTDMTATRTCQTGSCGISETKTIAKATGHAWQVISGTDATCTTPGTVTRFCPVCQTKEAGKEIAALGHSMTKVVEIVAPTCTEAGYTVVTCARGCDVTEKINNVAANGHDYHWKVVTPPSASGNGKNAKICSVCGDVAATKTVKYSKVYYDNNMTSFGPTTKELVGGNEWLRVTPIDTAVDGVYTYDLIASNRYVVGTVTIKVASGVLTVSYDALSCVDVKSASLMIYASKADLAAGAAVTAAVDSDINMAETFGEDTKVIVSLVLTGDYDAAGNGVVAMYEDAAEIAEMMAVID